MNELRDKLTSAITDFCALHGATPSDFELRLGTTLLGRVNGLLIWDRYDTMEVSSRQNELWDYLYQVLDPEDLRFIPRIYTRGVSERLPVLENYSENNPAPVFCN